MYNASELWVMIKPSTDWLDPHHVPWIREHCFNVS